jgi:hypothetical protein
VSAQKKAQDPQEVHRRLQKMLGHSCLFWGY